MAHQVQKIILATPRGFCAGVGRAIRAVEQAIDLFGAPVYVKHEIVHNKHVVKSLEEKGARTIDDVREAPDGAVVVFSAHGSPPEHYALAKEKNIRLIDATCPLVTKVHLEAKRFLSEGYELVYIGHKGHVEGIGVLGEAGEKIVPLVETVEDVEKLEIGNPEKLVYLTQTTLSVDDTREVIEALRKKYPQISAPPLEDICYATTNRQAAVKELAEQSDLVLIFGSKTSSNSTRLMETARAAGKQAHLIDDISELEEKWLENVETVGISAGASVPESLVVGAIEHFMELGAKIEQLIVRKENMAFSEPLELMLLKKQDTINKIQIEK